MNRELSVEDVRALYLKVLKRRGFSFEFDDEKDIVFKLKDIELKFIILVDAQHLEFIRICCPNFYKVNPAEEVKVYKACNGANLKTKVGKVYVSAAKKTVWSAYESIVRRIDEKVIESSLDTALVTIHLGIKNFIDSVESGE